MSEPTTSSALSSPAALASQARAMWGKLPDRARFAAIAIVVGVLGAIAWLTLGHHDDAWAPVAQQLSPDDAAELSAVLSSHAIPSRVAGAGKIIEVPADRLPEARVAAAAAGLPRGGVGFEGVQSIEQ